MRPKGSAKELEVRRLLGVKILSEGKSVREVARLIGVWPGSVQRWKEAKKKGGMEALKAKPHPGRKAKLSAKQKEELKMILLKGPRAAGFPTELWTCPRVAEVIGRHFGVRFHVDYVWYILRSLGWSCQKPERRARERDEEAIELWRRRRWPHIKKGSKTPPKHRFR